MEQILIQGVSMRGVFHMRLVHVLGTLGAALGAIGFFLPFWTQIFTGVHGFFAPPYPAGTVLTDSFWQMFVNTIRGGASALYFPLPLESLIIGVFLLSILFPLGVFLAALLGKQKTSLLLFSLLLTFLGFLEFVFYSAFLFGAFPTVATRTAGPGFWLMLIGFLLSLGSALWEALVGPVKPPAPRPS